MTNNEKIKESKKKLEKLKTKLKSSNTDYEKLKEISDKTWIEIWNVRKITWNTSNYEKESLEEFKEVKDQIFSSIEDNFKS